MRGVNKVIIIGNLGADPEHRQFEGGSSVANISVATSEQWTDKNSGEKREATEWHRISLFNRLGEVAAQYLRKGSKVYIEGSLRTRKYQDPNGQDRYVTEIRADQMQMLDGKNDGQAPNNQQGNYNQPAQQNNQNNQSQNQQQGFNNQMTNQGQPPQQNQQGGNYQQPRSETGLSAQNNAPANNQQKSSMPPGPVDDDIPFAPYFDGQY